MLLYEGLTVRINAGDLKQGSKFYKAVDGLMARIIFVMSAEEAYVEFSFPVTAYSEHLQKYVVYTHAEVLNCTLRPVGIQEDEFLPGCLEDFL